MSARTGDGATWFVRLSRLVTAALRAVLRPVVLLGTMLAALTAVVLFLGWCLVRLPVDGGMSAEAGAPASLVLETAAGEAFAARGVLRGDPIVADRLPQPLAGAVVAIEDRRFRDHGGIDLRGILRAGLRNLSTGRTREGASTITQQLARLLYLSSDRTLTRKTQEVLIALWLERQLSKDEILARYLGGVYFGAGAWGADAAARRYFGKGAAELSLAEAAMLAGLVRAPSQLAPTRNLEGARRRAELVLTAMVETGRVTEQEAAVARASPATPRTPPEMAPGRGYFADWAEAEARRLLGPVPVDLVARTTLDPALQDVAERIVGAWLDREGGRANARQAALVAMTHDGAVLAAVGGRDYGSSQFSRVTQARRQAGSLFKLFVYAAALEAGWRPDSPVVDQPVRIGSWEPQNFGGRHRGTTTLREAFAQSINTVAVQLSESVGRERVVEVARRLGIRSELPLVPSIALGSTEVTLLEITAAFASAAGNTRVEPYVVSAVRARDRALYARAEPSSGVVRSQAAAVFAPAAQQDLIDLLLAVVREGTGRTARLQRPVAGKTGTTQEHRDAWFVGITADVVVGVWVGNDDNTPMNGVTGGELPARIWRDFVSEADRLKAAAAQAATAPPGDARARVVPPGPPPVAAAPPARALLRGPAVVMDTATLRIGRQVVRLAGLVGRGGGAAREMAHYLAGREVVCEPAADAGYHRCRAGERDLSEVVLSNGGGRATTDADPALREAEAAARAAGRGIWEAQDR